LTGPVRPTPCAGVVCFRGDEVLLIRRGTAPRLGQWSIPGGRIEPGEPASIAAMRELREETGVEAGLLGLVDVVDWIDEERHYVLIDYAARWIAREPVAGDDAAEARFVPVAALQDLGLWDETLKVILQAYLAFGVDASG
jgi:8-oxo-dGTP diphosphatase